MGKACPDIPVWRAHCAGWAAVLRQECGRAGTPNDAWEVLLGYDQEKMMGERAGAGLLPDIQAVDQCQRTPADAM